MMNEYLLGIDCGLTKTKAVLHALDGTPLGVAGCPNNGTCAARIVPSTVGDGVTSKALPLQCDPGKGKHAAGTECLLGDDCTSGVCTGTVWSALDLGKSFAPCPGSFPFGPTCSITSARAGRGE